MLSKEGMKGLPVGLYGISARIAAESSGTEAEYPYNGPENCVMRCLAGSDAVLVCDPAVVGSAMSSVDFIERNGYGKIPVEMHGAAASEKN